MKKILTTLDQLRNRLSQGKLSTILVLLSYIFFTFFYMGPSITRCTDTLYGFGDNTAGPVWRMWLEPKQAPLGSYENMTDYPKGENLYSPTNYSLSGQSVGIWGLSRVFGPVCGYNIFNAAGFVLSAIVMYGFILELTRRKSIAWLAGFAVSFSPYFQMKVGGHPGYGYQAFLIGAVWAFFNLLKKQRKRDVLIFAAVLASCFYFDPYFSLLVVCMVAPLAIVWLGLSLVGYRKKRTKATSRLFNDTFKHVMKSAVLFVLLLLPLVFVTAKNAKQITSSVAASRGNVLFEARACSNLPHEYVTPFVLHPIFERLIGKDYYIHLIDSLHSGFSCGIGEDTVGISILIVMVVSVGLVIFFWEYINKRRLKLGLGYDTDIVLLGILAILVVGFVMGLPPIKLLGFLPTPTYVLLKITTTWRTLTRLYVVVNFAFITLFSIVLVYFGKYFKKYRKTLMVVFLLLFGAILVEYQAFKPFTGNKISTFSYQKDTPTPYTWLSKQSDISVIAEYPIEKSGGESNAMAYYLSMQVIHNKKLFNGAISTSKDEEVKSSLKDISDPQTVQTLASIGVDAVVIHGVDEAEIRKISGLEIIHTADQERFNMLSFTPLVKKDNVVIVRVKPSQATSMMLLKKGFARNTNIILSAADWSYESLNNSEIAIVGLPGQKTTAKKAEKRCFEVRMASPGDKAGLTVKADGVTTIKQEITSDYVPLQILAKDKIQLVNNNGHNMQVRNLGCSAQ